MQLSHQEQHPFQLSTNMVKWLRILTKEEIQIWFSLYTYTSTWLIKSGLEKVSIFWIFIPYRILAIRYADTWTVLLSFHLNISARWSGDIEGKICSNLSINLSFFLFQFTVVAHDSTWSTYQDAVAKNGVATVVKELGYHYQRWAMFWCLLQTEPNTYLTVIVNWPIC